MTLCDSEDSFGVLLNCEMVSFAIPSTLEGPPSSRQAFLHNRKQVSNAVATASNREGVSCHYLPRQCVVNEFAARATPPPMRRVSKRLVQVVCYPNGSTRMEHLACESAESVCS
jgi:hypothetical protein